MKIVELVELLVLTEITILEILESRRQNIFPWHLVITLHILSESLCLTNFPG